MSTEHASIGIPDYINQSYQVLGLEEMQLKIQRAMAFQEQIKKLLDVDSDDEALEKIRDLWLNEDCVSGLTQLRIVKLENELKTAKKTIERLVNADNNESQLSGIAAFLNMPSDTKQPDICMAILNLKKENKKAFYSNFHLEVIAKYLKLEDNVKGVDVLAKVIELQEELDEAKLTITRLVNE